MNSPFNVRFGQALKKIGLTEKVTGLNPNTLVCTAISYPKFFRLLQELEIPTADYIGATGELTFTGFSDIKLTNQGAEKIRGIGRVYGDESRADQLAELGLKNMRALYLGLKFSDFLSFCAYHEYSKISGAVA